ncbi:hypothetical protein VC83_07001 [Pseudogymnoascus destructans]|uniref:Rho-GAP domain-containing protein n=2 Tax=Pseudogymnoascus destructans TaxID=655981 RepID=L8GC82_PSED2|nr:uncharacterized protein VC83_07001 [Pseudogymnoascus destructans]ELR09631.1 hypothetical protein GMDG_04122 [Pseudogymnoascus destructans 20631-21]OAF56913.2 hypothetical protein VC83_07001 [Pseudogymnoascus destructans]
MVRKPTPLVFTSTASSNDGGAASAINEPPQSDHSVKSPGPRSFRFSKKPSLADNPENLSGMQAPEQYQFPQSARIPSSPHQDSLGNNQQNDGSTIPEGQRAYTPSTSPQRTGFFANMKASKSSNRLQQAEAKRPATRDRTISRDSVQQGGPEPRDDGSTTRRLVASPSRSEPQLNTYADSTPVDTVGDGAQANYNSASRRPRPKGFNLLRRTSSIRNDSEPMSSGESSTLSPNDQDRQQVLEGLRTAPLRADNDRTFRDLIKNSNSRNRSADRQPSGQRPEVRREPKDTHRGTSSISMSRDTGGTSLINSLKGAGTKAASSFGRNFFGKSTRSGSTNEKEGPIDDEHYVLRVLNLPLIEQTRVSRISKQLETSRDKTEFWMPSFPWRAIDYLNYRGTDAEGLYRVPGSGPQIRKWQRKFDQDLDVDLFAQTDLYDINIVGSMLKSWLRELPDELFPKDAQERVSKESPNCEDVPQVLIDELSNLPPYNYYLLFAITCHLSLVLEHREANKMNYQNLTVCFLPCMRMDAYCFRFLVVKWRDCWKGCNTEAVWLEKEARWREETNGTKAADDRRTSTAIEDRNVSSPDSSHPSSLNRGNQQRPAQSQEQAAKTSATTAPAENERPGYQYSRETPPLGTTNGGSPLTAADQRGLGGEREMLLPIQPMSPMYMPGSALDSS